MTYIYTMKKLLFLFLIYSTSISAQTPDYEGSYVQWMSLKEAMEKVKKFNKPIIVDFYTDWCGWCKTMMKTTYANQELAKYINTNFYPVKFNAEGKDTVEFLGQKYLPTSPEPRTTHPLAIKLLGGKLMYPTTLFLNGYDSTKNEFRVNMIANGYLDQKKIEPILIFVLENAGRNCSYDDFNAQFEKTFFDSTLSEKEKKIKWMTPKSAFEMPNGKKSLVRISADWCASCKVMKTSFIDSSVVKYISEKFNVVDFNPEMTDTILFKGQKFFNARSPQLPFHQLAIQMGRNSISFPSLIVLDENLETIDVIPSYISPSFLKDISHFYGDDIYKKKSWAEFMQSPR